MTRKEYEQLKSQAEAEHRSNIEAIERVWRLSQEVKESELGLRPESKLSSNGKSFGKGDLLKAVKRAINEVQPKFTARHIHEWLHENRPGETKKPSVKSALARLQKDGYLDVVIAGRGRRPSVFQKHQ